jgi:uncharacterized protein (TIGR03437 family)
MRSLLVCLGLAVLPIAGAVPPSITGAGPNPIDAGGPYFPLTINGSGFVNGSVARWGQVVLSTTFVSSSQLLAEITPDLRLISDNYPITVTNPDTTVSNKYAITVSPVLASVTPAAVVAGSPAVTVKIAGIGFQAGVQVQFSSAAGTVNIDASVTDSARLTAVIPASALASAQSASIRIVNTKADPSGGNASASLPFEIRGTPAISSASPNPIDAGGGYFLLDVTGTGFTPGSVVNWPGVPALGTTYVSATHLQAAITPDLRSLAGGFQLTVTDPATGATSNSYAEIVSPVLFGVSPATAAAGGAAVTITATGAGFTPKTALAMTASGQQSSLATTYVSATTLTGAIPANALSAAGNLSIQVIDSAGGGHSLAQTVSVARTVAAVASLVPNAVTAGAAAFTLTVIGSNFASGAAVLWNGSALATTFVSATQLAAQVPAALVQAAGAASIAVANSGAPTSASVNFVINPPPPTLASIAPVSAPAGGASFTLTITASNCGAGCVVQWNGAPQAGNAVSATQITATVPASLIAAPGTATIWLVNAAGASSNAATFVINPPAPTLTSMTPSSITAGSASATLTVNGTGFAAGALVLWNGTPLATTFVNTRQLTTTVPGSLYSGLLSAAVTVSNPGGAVSNSLTVNIEAPRPTIASLAPASVAAGSGPLALAVSGQNFAVNCVVRWNGAPLYTTFTSATQATATVPADLVANPGSASITLANPSGLEADAASFTITTPVPSIGSINPVSAAAGAPGVTLTISGSNFLASSKALWNGSPLATTFAGGTILKADVPAALLAAPGLASVTVFTPGAAPCNAAVFTIGVPVPTTVTAGIVNAASSLPAIAPGSLISIYGVNLAPGNAAAPSLPLPAVLNGTSVAINGIAAPLVFVSASQINAQVPFEVQPGSATLQIQAGTLQSVPVSFSVQAIAPGVLPVVQNAAGGTVNSPQAPAPAGQYVTVYVTGQGTVDPPVETGAAAPSADPFALPLAAVQAQIGGQDAAIAFAGLAPGLAGLMQVNLLVPDVPAGDQPLVVTVGGVQSNAVTVSVGPVAPGNAWPPA